MAYAQTWDESQPDGSENANTIDDEIRNLKITLRERLANILDATTAWETDAHDPKLLSGAAFVAGGITFAARASERAVASLGASMAIANTTSTAVIWDTEQVDEGGLVDIGAQPTRITIVNTGFYLVTAFIPWGISGTGIRTIGIRPNGSSIIARTVNSAASFVSGSTPQQSVTFIGVLTAADYLEVLVYQSSGGSLDVLTSFDIPRFSIVRLA